MLGLRKLLQPPSSEEGLTPPSSAGASGGNPNELGIPGLSVAMSDSGVHRLGGFAEDIWL